MTAPQNPITRAIWDGALPIKFSLDAGEASAAGANTIIEPYFVSCLFPVTRLRVIIPDLLFARVDRGSTVFIFPVVDQSNKKILY